VLVFVAGSSNVCRIAGARGREGDPLQFLQIWCLVKGLCPVFPVCCMESCEGVCGWLSLPLYNGLLVLYLIACSSLGK